MLLDIEEIMASSEVSGSEGGKKKKVVVGLGMVGIVFAYVFLYNIRIYIALTLIVQRKAFKT